MRMLAAFLAGLSVPVVCLSVCSLLSPIETCNYEIEVETFNGQTVVPVNLLIREFENGSVTAEYVNPFR